MTFLACRRLRSPLELSLSIEESVTTGIVDDDCLKSLEGNATLLHLAGSKAAQATLSRLRMVNLPGPIRLLLSAAYKGLDQNYRNALRTVCICAGFAAPISSLGGIIGVADAVAAILSRDDGNCSVRARTVESRPVEGKRRIRGLLDGSRAVAVGDGMPLLQPLIDILDGDAGMPALVVS